MKFAVKQRSKPATLALTSMLDVIFLLLCFFVTASVYSQWESEISIQLPTAKTSDDPDRLPGELIANRADRETSYDALVKVIDVCRGAGVWNFSLATSNEDRGK